MDREEYMEYALALASRAAEEGEIPVGCIIADADGNIIGRGRNKREESHDATHHAEIEAIDQACRRLNGWRLSGSTLYVTLEPCPMCAGAILNARIGRVVYGAADPKAGSLGSVTDLFALPYNHHPVVESGLLEQECAQVLSAFFQNLRKQKSR